MIPAPPSREEMIRRWAAKRPAKKKEPAPRPLNLGHVMDLGSTVYFIFRGRPYGIPPLAWREGEKILDLYTQVEEIGQAREAGSSRELGRSDLPSYFEAIRSLQSLLWRNCRPRGWLARLRHRLRLHPNPFKRATESEVLTLALFMLGRRTKVGDLRFPESPGLAT